MISSKTIYFKLPDPSSLLVLSRCVIALTSLFIGLKFHDPPRRISVPQPNNYSPLRILLLICMTFVFALEICYKLATRQAVFVFQPCHMLCIIHIILLGEIILTKLGDCDV